MTFCAAALSSTFFWIREVFSLSSSACSLFTYAISACFDCSISLSFLSLASAIIYSRIFFCWRTLFYSILLFSFSCSISNFACSKMRLSKSSLSYFALVWSSWRTATCLSSTSLTFLTLFSACSFSFRIFSSCRRWPNFWISPHSSSLISDGKSSTATDLAPGNFMCCFF